VINNQEYCEQVVSNVYFPLSYPAGSTAVSPPSLTPAKPSIIERGSVSWTRCRPESLWMMKLSS
jgi:hypothetical protein